MPPRIRFIFFLIIVVTLGCDKAAKQPLRGQSNVSLKFYGLAVDETARPLEGVRFEIEVEAIPKNWTFETRGAPHLFSSITAQSGPGGEFEVDVDAHILRIRRVELAGYRHFYDLAAGDSRAVTNTFYGLGAWGDVCYKSDPKTPAVFVLVRDGNTKIVALPSRGGYDSGNGKTWTSNIPAWPRNPSLNDVSRAR